MEEAAASEFGGTGRRLRPFGARRHLSYLYRRHHPLVWVAVGLNIAFMLTFALLVPPFHGIDERAHFDMIHQYQREPALYQPERRRRFVVIAGPVDNQGKVIVSGGRLKRLKAVDAAPRTDRPTLADLGAPQKVRNQMSQHPPLYYLGMAEVTRLFTVPERFWSWDRELLLARVLSVLFLAPLALLASEAALALGLARRVGAVAAAFTLLIPQKTYVGSMVSNDSLVMLLAAVSVVAALRYLAGGTARNAWVAAGAGAGLALTKSTGAVVTAWVVLILAYGIFQRWRRGEHRDAIRTLGVTAALTAIGASWYVTNLVQYGRPQPHPTRGEFTPVPSHFGHFIFRFFDLISQTFWGLPARRLGIALPWWMSHLLSVFTIVCVVLALVTARSLTRFVLPLFGLVVAQGATLLQATWATNRMHNLGLTKYLALQGRYLFPILIPLAVLVAVAVFRVLGWLFSPRSVTIAAVVMLVIGGALHFAMELMMLNGYWQGPHLSWARHLGAFTAWSPLPVAISYLVLALPLIVCAVALAPVANRARVGLRQPSNAPAIATTPSSESSG